MDLEHLIKSENIEDQQTTLHPRRVQSSEKETENPEESSSAENSDNLNNQPAINEPKDEFCEELLQTKLVNTTQVKSEPSENADLAVDPHSSDKLLESCEKEARKKITQIMSSERGCSNDDSNVASKMHKCDDLPKDAINASRLQSSEERSSAVQTDNLDKRDNQQANNDQDNLEEPTDEFFEDILQTKSLNTTEVKSELPQNENPGVDLNFFDGFLERGEKELGEQETQIVRLKRGCPNNDDSDVASKKMKCEDLPKLKIRSDLTTANEPERIRDPFGESLLLMNTAMSDEQSTQRSVPKLTTQEKISKALERIRCAKREFEKSKSQNEKKFYLKEPVFAYTPTVRKLPSSCTRYTQQIYDNRSPLHTVNNVCFSFNSTTTRLNLHEWGLETPPPAVVKVARILGYDAETLCLKRNSIKIPDKIQKSQSAPTDADTLFQPSNSTLFINATVQTDEVRILPVRRGQFYRNIGVQFTPETSVIGTQTSAAYCGGSVSNLPFMKLIGSFNENQLQAMDDFAQLIAEPVAQAGIQVYENRLRLNEIYKLSQQPSFFSEALPPAPPPPLIRGPNFVGDSNGQNRYDQIKREPNRDPRFNQLRNRPSPYQSGRLEPISDWEPPSSSNLSTKFYGRGGKRR